MLPYAVVFFFLCPYWFGLSFLEVLKHGVLCVKGWDTPFVSLLILISFFADKKKRGKH